MAKKRKSMKREDFSVKRLPVERIALNLNNSNVKFIKETAERIGISRDFIVNVAILDLRKLAEEQHYSSEELFRLMHKTYDQYLEEEELKRLTKTTP